jgi:hypothetical protein
MVLARVAHQKIINSKKKIKEKESNKAWSMMPCYYRARID